MGPLLFRSRASAQDPSCAAEENIDTGIPLLKSGNHGATNIVQSHPELGGLVRLGVEPRSPLGISCRLLAHMHVRFLLDEVSEGPVLTGEGSPKAGKQRRGFARLGHPAAGRPQNRRAVPYVRAGPIIDLGTSKESLMFGTNRRLRQKMWERTN